MTTLKIIRKFHLKTWCRNHTQVCLIEIQKMIGPIHLPYSLKACQQ